MKEYMVSVVGLPGDTRGYVRFVRGFKIDVANLQDIIESDEPARALYEIGGGDVKELLMFLAECEDSNTVPKMMISI